MLRTCLLTALLLLGAASAPVGAAESPVTAGSAALTPVAMSWNWDWDECRKFWSKQLGKTTGVVGTVSVVVVIGVLIVMSAKKKT
jgi:hypothetical protein